MADQEIVSDCFVADFGSGYSKVGFSGGDSPDMVFPTIIGRPRESSFKLKSGESAETLVGKSVLDYYSELFVDNPIDRGMLINTTDGQNLFDYSLASLSADVESTPVLVTEPALVSQSFREKLSEICFETLESPSLYLLNSSTAALFSVGRTSGVVVNCGDGLISALPITEGFCCSHALYSSEFAGRDLTRDLKSLILAKLENSSTSTNFFEFEKLKEKHCFISLDSTKEKAKPVKVKLPDGQQISLGNERFEVVESIFNPDVDPVLASGKKISRVTRAKALPEAVCESIATTEEEYEVRQTFFENIMLTGGLAKMKGFKERFMQDLKEFAPSEIDAYVIDEEGTDKTHSTWVGGSIMALLSTTRDKFVTREEFLEYGAEAVLQKIPMYGM